MTYENFAELVEVPGTFILPRGHTRVLRVLLDIGSTNNFIHRKIQKEYDIPVQPDSGRTRVTLGGSGKATARGETKSLTMKIGSFKHESTYTIMDLGQYDIVLGMPFFKFHKVVAEMGENPRVQVTTPLGPRSLPVRLGPESGQPVYALASRADLKREERAGGEMYQLLPQFSDPGPTGTPATNLKFDWFAMKSEPTQGGADPKGPEDDPLDKIPRTRGIEELENLLREFRDVFPADLPAESPPPREISMKIELRDGADPPAQAPYRVSDEAKKVIEETIKYLYDHGLARDSLSEYAAPVTLAKKADGTWRFCVDYRKLNSLTKEAKYPLPRIEDCLDQLRGAVFFTKLDLRSGYWQVRVREEDVEKTAFRTHMGHHEFLVVPMGLQGAPSCFQRLMNHYFRAYLGKFVLVYLDDILIYSRTKEEHLQHIRLVLALLREKKLYAKSSKCDLFREEVSFLGFLVKAGLVSTDPRKVQVVKDWQPPKTVRELRSFLGLCNFYRKFVKDYAKIAKPLTDILKSTQFEETFGHKFTKTAPIWLDTKAQQAFESLKTAMTEAPCLAIFDPEKTTEVWADASWENQTVGAVLMQDHGNGLQPVAFMSKVMNGAQARYPTFEQELLALKLALEEWKHYLLPITFTARTDHHGLKYLKSQKHLSERQWHWLAFFSEFHFFLHYRPGANMQVPDALSRRVHSQEEFTHLLRVCDHDEEAHLEINVPTAEGKTKVLLHMQADKTSPHDPNSPPLNLKFEYKGDKDFEKIFEILKNKVEPLPPSADMYHLEEDLLYWVDKTAHQRVCVPKRYRVMVLKEFHDTPTGGHFGSEKTYESLKRYFYWPNMKTTIEQYVSTCDLCQKSKDWTRKRYRDPQLPDVPLEPWTVVAIDFCGPFPKTKRGHDSVCAVYCLLTREAIFMPCQTTITAKGTAELYVRGVFRYKGLPRRFISDRGPQFIASFWQHVWEMLGTTATLNAPYHPQSNPMERGNKTFVTGLRIYVCARQDDWDDKLILFEFAYNNTVNPSTGQTPFYLNTGRHPLVPAIKDLKTNQPAVEDFVLSIKNELAAARDCLLRTQAANADRQGPDFQTPTFQVGDLVLLSTANLRLKLASKKLEPKWIGPLKILQIRGPNTVLLEPTPRLKDIEPIQNVLFLKPYKTRPAELGPQVIHLPPEIIKGEEEFEVEDILAHRYKGKKLEYLVRFKSYGPEEDKWLPAVNLKNAPLIVKGYHKRQKL